jgi:dolichyl-phosphate beta-glucosyltransferase
VPGIRDTQCGFKLFRRVAARELFREARVDRFAWDVEILYLARRRGMAIAEVPVLWFNSPESKVRVVRDAIQTLWDVARIRWMHRA